MATICRQLDLSSQERALLESSDTEVENWLAEAKKGEGEERDKLLRWAFVTAKNYYCWKVKDEKILSLDDAEDLAQDFYLYFHDRLNSTRSAVAITRYVLKEMLKQFLRRKREHLKREISLSDVGIDEVLRLGKIPDWTDETAMKYWYTMKVKSEMDEKTRKIIDLRTHLTHEEIAKVMKMKPTTVRKRFSRFKKKVLQRYKSDP